MSQSSLKKMKAFMIFKRPLPQFVCKKKRKPGELPCPKTANAVKRFQSVSGLTADGIYGPKTKAKIEEKSRCLKAV
jgi:murein L,D-transpeptidase YcbB/YkuD